MSRESKERSRLKYRLPLLRVPLLVSPVPPIGQRPALTCDDCPCAPKCDFTGYTYNVGGRCLLLDS